MNAAMSVREMDLFRPIPVFKSDWHYGLILSAAHPGQLDKPAFVNFAIPNSDLSGWLFNQSIESVIAAYAPPEMTIERIPDLVAPRLKKPKKQAE